MHRISTASSASTVVICTITQLCYVLVCASTKLPQLHRLAQLSPAWLAQMCLILRVSSQHFLSSVSLWNHGQVFHPIFVHVLWNYKINVTFEGLIGNYAVLSQIQSLLDLRLFCANFLSQIVRLCSFLCFLQVCHDHHRIEGWGGRRWDGIIKIIITINVPIIIIEIIIVVTIMKSSLSLQ